MSKWQRWVRPLLIVCKPCDLERCKAVLDATELKEEQRSQAEKSNARPNATNP